MRDGTWPDSAVRTTAARAFLDGVEQDIDTVSLTSEMTADFALDGGGDPVTDGTVAWPQQSAVATTVPQPFHRESVWPPAPATPLTVEVGDGSQWWKQITGLIDSSTGSLAGPQVTSAVVDHIDKLSTRVWHGALLAIMPPYTAGGLYRRIGLTGVYATDLAARTAGFYATPPATPDTLLSVPCMGSMWAHVGECVSSGQFADDTLAVDYWRRTDYGVAARNVDATYTFDPSPAVVVSICLEQPQPNTTMTVNVLADVADPRGFVLYQSAGDRVAVAQVTAGQGDIVSLQRNGAKRAAVSVSRDSDGTLQVTLRLSDGREISGSRTAPEYADSMFFFAARLAGSGSVGGLLIDPPERGFGALSEPTTAVFRCTPFGGDTFRAAPQPLDAMPAFIGVAAKNILVEQAAAQCSSFWIDSEGRLRWADLGVLDADPYKLVKATELGVDNLSWSDDVKSLRRTVTMKHRAAAVSRSVWDTVLLWQSPEQELMSGQTLETWVEPGADEDWVMPDLNFERIYEDVITPTIPYGSKTAATYVDDNPQTLEGFSTTSVYQFLVEFHDSPMKIIQSAGEIPNGKRLATKIPSDAINIQRNWRGAAFPLLRGRGKVQWKDLTTSHPAGITGTGTYEHDCGWYVQNPSRRETLKNWIIAAVTAPRPQVTVDIDPDPRLEVGDKVRIRDESRTGIELDVVITRLEQSWGGDRPSMALSGRVTRVAKIRTVADPVSVWETFVTNWKAS